MAVQYLATSEKITFFLRGEENIVLPGNEIITSLSTYWLGAKDLPVSEIGVKLPMQMSDHVALV